MPWTVAVVMLPRLLPGLVTMQIASRAILVNTRPPGSPAAGSREEAPMETRPFETSDTPTLDPPCRIRNPYFLPCLVLIHFRASWVSSGKTEVDPLMVMIFFACAAAGRAANSDSAATAASRRTVFRDTDAPFGLSNEDRGSVSALRRGSVTRP